MIQLKEEVIAELVSLEIPGAQKLLRAGFKQVTESQMRDRFGCDLIQEKENKTLLEEFKKKVPIKHHKSIYIRRFSGGNCRYGTKPFWRYGEVSGSSKECTLQIESYDNYINEVIPDRVTESAQTAKRLGAKNLSVVYPVLREAPLNDPILVEVLDGNRYIEIDCWE